MAEPPLWETYEFITISMNQPSQGKHQRFLLVSPMFVLCWAAFHAPPRFEKKQHNRPSWRGEDVGKTWANSDWVSSPWPCKPHEVAELTPVNPVRSLITPITSYDHGWLPVAKWGCTSSCMQWIPKICLHWKHHQRLLPVLKRYGVDINDWEWHRYWNRSPRQVLVLLR